MCSDPSQAFVSNVSLQCEVNTLDLHRSARLICLGCWLYSALPQPYALIAERGSHWLDLNMISNTHQKYRLANFLQNKIYFKLVSTSFFAKHSGCLSMTQKQEINNLQLKGWPPRKFVRIRCLVLNKLKMFHVTNEDNHWKDWIREVQCHRGF